MNTSSPNPEPNTKQRGVIWSEPRRPRPPVSKRSLTSVETIDDDVTVLIDLTTL